MLKSGRLAVLGVFALLLSDTSRSQAHQHDTDLQCEVSDASGQILRPTHRASSISIEGNRGLSGSSDLFGYDVSLTADTARLELRNKVDGDRAVLAKGPFRKGEQLSLSLGPKKNPERELQLSCRRN